MKRILVSLFVLLTIFIVAPNISSASTISDLQAQIVSLLAQVQQLKAKLAQIQGNNGLAWCHTFNNDLSVGSSGDEVGALISVLAKEGFARQQGQEVSSNFSSTYDETIASFVSAFQEKYKSEILNPAALTHGTGYLGARTRAKLNQLYGCGSTQPQPEYKSVTVQNLMGNPSSYLSQKVQVSGKLVLRGSYNNNPAFFITTETNTGTSEFSVIPWVPFEIVLPPNGSIPIHGPVIMQDYVDRNVTLKGIVILVGSSYQLQVSSATLDPVACTMEAKLCPDGKTYVGRTGPKCEFALCPVTSSEPLTVIYPNGGESFSLGSTITIKWVPIPSSAMGTQSQNTADVSAAPIRVSLVDEDGYSNERFIADVSRTVSSYAWTIPKCSPGNECSSNFQIAPGKYKIKVSGYRSDLSDQSFTITQIWPSSCPAISPLLPDYCLNGKIISGVDTNGCPTSYCSASDTSPVSINVVYPAGGETWSMGSAQNIQWTYTGTIKNVSISLMPADASWGARNIALTAPNTGSYFWTIPRCSPGNECSSNFQISAGKYKVQISGTSIYGVAASDSSDFLYISN